MRTIQSHTKFESIVGNIDVKEIGISSALRTNTHKFLVLFSAGNKAELGANWIHGVLGNPLYELAVAKGLVS